MNEKQSYAEMEAARFQAIRKRLLAATRGPWTAHEGLKMGCDDRIESPSGRVLVSPYIRPADGEFIAHAREDVDWLLSIIDELSLAATCDCCGRPRNPGTCSGPCELSISDTCD